MAYGGAQYESLVKKTVRKNIKKVPNLFVVPDGSSTFDQNGIDMVIKHKGRPYGFEIKQNNHAQMGGIAINYESGNFLFPQNIEFGKELQGQIDHSLSKIKKPLEELLKFLRSEKPIELNSRNTKLPIRTTEKAWIKATNKGLLKPLNINIAYDARFIYDHYAKKDVHYIQIGKMGLYHLKNNPFKFPIPQLDSEIFVECRLARGGIVYNASVKENVVGANIRAQAHLRPRTTSKSPFSLDEELDVATLFGKLL